MQHHLTDYLESIDSLRHRPPGMGPDRRWV